MTNTSQQVDREERPDVDKVSTCSGDTALLLQIFWYCFVTFDCWDIIRGKISSWQCLPKSTGWDIPFLLAGHFLLPGMTFPSLAFLGYFSVLDN